MGRGSDFKEGFQIYRDPEEAKERESMPVCGGDLEQGDRKDQSSVTSLMTSQWPQLPLTVYPWSKVTVITCFKVPHLHYISSPQSRLAFGFCHRTSGERFSTLCNVLRNDHTAAMTLHVFTERERRPLLKTVCFLSAGNEEHVTDRVSPFLPCFLGSSMLNLMFN